jgi:hypothetical protein
MNLYKEFFSLFNRDQEQQEKKGSVMNEQIVETEVLDPETGLPVVKTTTEQEPPFDLEPTVDGLVATEVAIQTPADKGDQE